MTGKLEEMHKLLKCRFLLLILLTWEVVAQPSHDTWKQAANLAKEEKWGELRDLLRPYTLLPPSDTLAPWFLQLYAVSSQEEGDWPSAISTGQKLLEMYPKWSCVSETRLLLGSILFQQQRFAKGWKYWEELPEEYVPQVREMAKKQFLIIPGDSLKRLVAIPGFDTHPIAQVLLSENAAEAQNQYPKPTPPKIGVVLPFQWRAPGKHKAENPALDFYRGVLLASEVLAAMDSAVEVHAFDSKNDERFVAKMQKNRAFDGLNLVLGPLKTNQLEPLATWPGKRWVPVIAPLTAAAPSDFDNCFLMQQATPQTIATMAFDFISPLSTGKNVGIVYGTEKNDSLMAEAYRVLMKKMGREITLFKKVGKNSAANLTKFLLEAGLDSTCHIFVPNNEPMVRVQLISAYSWLKAKYPILVYGKWLESKNIDYEEMSRHPIYFMNPDLPDLANPHWQEWNSSYLAKWGTPPSWIAWKGFDVTYSFARSWYKSGPGWCGEWKSGKAIKSELFGQYQYTTAAPDNHYLPVYKLDNSGVVRVWPQ